MDYLDFCRSSEYSRKKYEEDEKRQIEKEKRIIESFDVK
jgi:hypothetical protein